MRSHNNTTETQSGGIMLKMPPEEAFYTCINNSSVSLLSDQMQDNPLTSVSGVQKGQCETPGLKKMVFIP